MPRQSITLTEEWINQKLEQAEKSGFVDQLPEDILEEFKADLQIDKA